MRVAAVLMLLACARIALAQAGVEYVVRLDRAASQIVEVEMILHDLDAGEIELVMPTWRPGKYAILDPAGTVRRFTALDGAGNPLPWEKTRKSAWVVRAEGGTVRARYEIYANSLHDRTRYADDTHAFLSGSSVFLWHPPRREAVCVIRLEGAPEHWSVATGLEPVADDPRVLTSPSFDVLVDSPIEIGELETTSFEFGGAAHEIAIWGDGAWDLDALARDFAKIVEDQHAVFGELPYERYVFLLHVGPGMGGGTEHLNSTIMQTRPGSFESESSYRGFLGLVSHEFFHTWNVKQLRPAGIHPYDYEKENYTKLLWVAEGTTSYYDDLTLVRTGLIDVKEYFKRMGGSINSLRRSPGRKLQSLEESSFDSWIKFNKRTPDTGNTTISFYSKGALVSLMLDLELRQRTDADVTLDHVMRALYQHHPLDGPGYTPADVVRTCAQLTGEDFSGFFDANVSGVNDLEFEPLLESVGVELYFKPDEAPWRLGAESESDEGDDAETEAAYERIDLGLSLTSRAGNVYVRSVREGGACFESGIIADDELIAINGERVGSADVKALLEGIAPGETITLTTSRRGVVIDREVIAESRPAGAWTLRRLEDATLEQRANYELWLRQDWPGDGDDESDAEEAP